MHDRHVQKTRHQRKILSCNRTWYDYSDALVGAKFANALPIELSEVDAQEESSERRDS